MKKIFLFFFLAMISGFVFCQDSTWKLLGNAGITGSHFLGTTDNRPLLFKVNSNLAGWIDNGIGQNTTFGYTAGRAITIGQRNTAIGYSALYFTTRGSSNTAVGHSALHTNSTGANNTALGANALSNNTSGSYNSAFGAYALNQNTTGGNNVALGFQAMYMNQDGHHLVAIGPSVLYQNTHGYSNIAIGDSALYNNTTGWNNVALGIGPLAKNISGRENIAIGSGALYNNVTGEHNIAAGFDALSNTTSGVGNIAIGQEAMFNSTEGFWNVAIGLGALYGENTYTTNTGHSNTAIGLGALAYGGIGYGNVAVGSISGNHKLDRLDNNTMVGTLSGIFMSSKSCENSTALGHSATITASNQVRVGDQNITSIGGYEDWTNISDSRFKKNIQQNVPGLEFILQLKPVTYNLDVSGLNDWLGVNKPPAFTVGPKPDWPLPDENAIRQKENQLVTGFLAQEVEAAAKKINYNFSGVDAPKNEKDLYGLRYAQFVVPLVKATQEQQAMIKDQQTQIEALKQQNLELQQQLQEIKIKLGMETIITQSKEN